MATTRGRVVQANQVVFDQVDFFQSDGFTRVARLTSGHLEPQVFFNNRPLAWAIVPGGAIGDAQVAAGSLYFNEIPGLLGYYSIRFRPDALGYWRIVLTYRAGQQISAQDFDVVQSAPAMESGLKASFVKPEGNCGC
jgi:hypothetical protein